MKPKVIKNEAEYEATLARVAELMDVAPGSPEEQDLELFALLVEQYELRTLSHRPARSGGRDPVPYGAGRQKRHSRLQPGQMSQIETALAKIFDRQRIVFWYDVKRELRAEFDALALPGVEKIVLGNNQFGVKYRILREAPEQKFLLYHEGPPPEDIDNWLLDVELAHGSFRADQTALWVHELGLGPEFTGVIGPHAEFFQAVRRREALKAALRAG